MTYLLTIAVIFSLLAGLIVVERLYRRFAMRNPELGPFRNGAAGCGSCGGCAGAACDTEERRVSLKTGLVEDQNRP
jgi:hypothetical protein